MDFITVNGKLRFVNGKLIFKKLKMANQMHIPLLMLL